MNRKGFVLSILVLILVLMGTWGAASAAPAAQVNEESSIIWGRVCLDADQDGECDLGEVPLAGVTVTLLNEDEEEEDTYVTGRNGLYQFTVTDDDTYYVVESDPPGYTSTGPNRVEVDGEPGKRVWAGDFCDVPAEAPPSTPLISTLSARVYIDYRGDGVFQSGIDIPLGNVPVTLSLPDDTSVELETTSFGMVYFSGFDATSGVGVSVRLPAGYRGYALTIGPGSSTSVQLQPNDFHFDHAFVEFQAEVIGEAAGP